MRGECGAERGSHGNGATGVLQEHQDRQDPYPEARRPLQGRDLREAPQGHLEEIRVDDGPRIGHGELRHAGGGDCAEQRGPARENFVSIFDRHARRHPQSLQEVPAAQGVDVGDRRAGARGLLRGARLWGVWGPLLRHRRLIACPAHGRVVSFLGPWLIASDLCIVAVSSFLCLCDSVYGRVPLPRAVFIFPPPGHCRSSTSACWFRRGRGRRRRPPCFHFGKQHLLHHHHHHHVRGHVAPWTSCVPNRSRRCFPTTTRAPSRSCATRWPKRSTWRVRLWCAIHVAMRPTALTSWTSWSAISAAVAKRSSSTHVQASTIKWA
mmetsp:Transcript_3476/g.21824  ORF Transcript_3476/g.21824 Transcript_3476/m.21824 type:complete len:322 (-) Transcript_3476:1089-2054(-)